METNKIYLGDAYKLIKDIPDKSIDLIITDPPYDIQGIQGAGIMASRKKGNFTQEIKENELDKGMDYTILEEFIRVQKKINVYIWCNKSMILPLLKFFVEENKCNYEIIIWAKEDPIPFCGTHYLVDKEYCLYFWETGAFMNIPFNRAKTFYLSRKNIQDKKNYAHPTIKNLEMIENFVLNSSKEGDLILDTFLGSGTTALACKHLNRQYIGFEINEKFYKIACERLEGINQKGEMNLFDL